MANEEISLKVKLIDAMSAGMKSLSSALRKMTLGFKNNFAGVSSSFTALKSSFSTTLSALNGIVLKTAAVGAGLAWGFKRNFLDVAAMFEDMETVLTTLEGSSANAKKAMAWISDFAVKTPYELSDVTEAYKNLVSSGIDPMNGSLLAIGDAAAASGKPLLQLVDAVGKAKSGQFEQLRTAIGGIYQTIGNKLTYTFFDQDKQKVTLYADVRNMEALEKLVYEVFDRKGYSGAMEGLSKTWSGMVSNLSDQWTRFSKMVMESGPFKWLKSELFSLLNTVDAMADNGSLQAWAEKTGAAFVNGFITAKNAVIEIWAALKSFGGFIQTLVGFVGGFKNALTILAAVMAGPLLIALGILMKSLAAFGLMLLTNPIGQFVVILFAAGVALKKIAEWSLKIASIIEGGTGWLLEKIFGRRKKQEEAQKNIEAETLPELPADRPVLFAETPVVVPPVQTQRIEESKTLRTEVVIRGENLPAGMRLNVASSDADRTEIGLTRTLAGA